MPFLVTATKTAKAVATTVMVSAEPEQVCFDKTPKLFGFNIGSEIITCFEKNPPTYEIVNTPPVIIYEPIHPVLNPNNIIYHQ